MNRSEMQMLSRAISQRWNIDPKYKNGAIHRLVKIIADPSSNDRAVVTAIKCLILMEKQNQDDEHKLVDVRIQQHNNRVDAIARELGIDPGLIADDRAKEALDFAGDENI